MILRLVIFSSLFSTCALPGRAAAVTGSVALVDTPREGARDLSGVVVWLEPLRPGLASPQPARARMIQKNKTFNPHVLAIPVGSTVDFPNFDPIFHNAFSNFNGQIFDIGLYPPGRSRSVVFRRAGVVRVFCNIHPTMSAVIVVLDTPYYGVTGKNGRFLISGVPAGTYRRNVFYERATPETLQSLSEEEKVGATELGLQPMTISEAGYLPAPHSNKYGKAYPHSAEEPDYSIPND